MAAIRRLCIGLSVRYKYYKKHSRFGLAWSRPHADRGLSLTMLNSVKITNDVDLSVLQAAINALCQWADTWQLSISVEKSCALCIGKTVPSTSLSINGASLPYVSSCRDLGIIITSDLTPTVHINDSLLSTPAS